MYDTRNDVTDLHLYNLAWDSKNKVDYWPMYYVNGYKFHIAKWGEGKKQITIGFASKVILIKERMIGTEC